MEIHSEDDFNKARSLMDSWRRQFPMFKHDVDKIENIIETHIQNYSIALVHYRQTKQRRFLERAQDEINEINRVILQAEKAQVMALLSQR